MLPGVFSLKYGFAAAFVWIYVIALGITAVSCRNTNSIALLSGQQPEIRHDDMISHRSANRTNVTINRDLLPLSAENLKTQKILISKRGLPNDQHGQNTNKDNTSAQTSSSQNNNSITAASQDTHDNPANTLNEDTDSQTNKQQGTQSSNSAASTDNQRTQKPDNVSSPNNDQQQSYSTVSTDNHQQKNSVGSDKPQITTNPTNNYSHDNDHQKQPTAANDNKHETSLTETAATNSFAHKHEGSQQPTATGEASSPSNTVDDNNKINHQQETVTNDNHTYLATKNDTNHPQPTVTNDSGRSHPTKDAATATDQTESVIDYTETTYIASTTDNAHTTRNRPSVTTYSNDHDSAPVTEQQFTTIYESTTTTEIIPTTTAKGSQIPSQDVTTTTQDVTTTTQDITTTSQYLATAITDRTTTSDEISSSIDKYSSTATGTTEAMTISREPTITSTTTTTDNPTTKTTGVNPTTATLEPTSSNIDDTSSLIFESTSFSFTTSEAFYNTMHSTSPTTTDALSSVIATAITTSPENSDTTTLAVAEQTLTTSFANGADIFTTLSSSDSVKTPTASITYYPTSTRLFSVSSSTATPLLVLGSTECTSDPHAVNGKCPYEYFCNAAKRSCVWLLENNQQCYEDFQCASTYCTKGICVPSGSVNKSNNGAKIAGATIGGLVGACLVLLALIKWRRRSRAIGRRMNRFNEEKFYDVTSVDKKEARLSKFNFLTQMLDSNNNHSAVQISAADLSNQQYTDQQLYAAQPSAHSHFTNQQEPQIYHADQQQSTGSSLHQIYRIPVAVSERPKPSVVATQSSYNPFRQTSMDNDAWSKEDKELMNRATYGYI